MIEILRIQARKFLPVNWRRKIVKITRWPPVGWVRFGSLRRSTPISPHWGSERGRPIDRYYIERFLADHAEDIRGRTLEIGDDTYTALFGGERVTQRDVLHVAERSEKVTLIGDLAKGENIPANAFDCIILTQTLQTIYDLQSAIAVLFRILKPGGVVLVTVPGISKISRYDMDRWGYYWSFTTLSARRLFETCFPPENVLVEAYGNVFTAIAFLHGLATEELTESELTFTDPDFEVLISIRAEKPAESA